LFLVAVARLAACADRFAIGDARLLERDRHAEPPQQPLDDHLELDFALARDDRLVDLVVDAVVKRRVLLVQRRETTASLSSSPFERSLSAPWMLAAG